MNAVNLRYTLAMVRHFLAAVSLSLVGAVAAQPALAQIAVPKPIATPDGQPTVRGHRQSEVPPPAVPGARAEPALVAPAEHVPTDMPPTEALFDSINRGDLIGARDAVGRGADIHGRNVLGLTPLEQSVDLGRNDISFLLLSLRGGAGYSTSNGRGALADAKPSPADTKADRRAAAAEAARERREQVATHAKTPPAPARNARLFAGDGGAPVPQAGFLGFDSAR